MTTSGEKIWFDTATTDSEKICEFACWGLANRLPVLSVSFFSELQLQHRVFTNVRVEGVDEGDISIAHVLVQNQNKRKCLYFLIIRTFVLLVVLPSFVRVLRLRKQHHGR